MGYLSFDEFKAESERFQKELVQEIGLDDYTKIGSGVSFSNSIHDNIKSKLKDGSFKEEYLKYSDLGEIYNKAMEIKNRNK